MQTQLHNELIHDYAFPRAVCKIVIWLFLSYFDLYFGNQRKEGQIIFHSISKDVPPGIPVDEMNLIPVTLSIYDPDDCTVRDQQELLDKMIVRICGEAYSPGALLTQADIAILLGYRKGNDS